MQATRNDAGPARSGFWSGYWSSLKPRAVEEPIDVWVHRPLAYLLAKAWLPTPVSPNVVTLLSIVFGVAAGVSLFASFPWHMQVGGLCLFVSAILDCADGQLARMRGTSSEFGRMLDGVADMVVAVAGVGGAIWVLYWNNAEPGWLGVLTLVAATATAVTGSFHTSMYDHYKNVYLRMTSERFREGEGYDSALARYRQRPKEQFGALARLAWPIYLFYLKSQEDYVRRFDPHTASTLTRLPIYDEERARIYRECAAPLMPIWRGWFGFGSLVFGMSVAAFFDVFEWYMGARLIILNTVFYAYLRPRQRAASKKAFGEMGVDLARAPVTG